MLVSIIIRTYNEQKHLEELLKSINQQKCKEVQHEVVIVDSGSTDKTLVIAEKYACRITHIKKGEFTFGRSLNIGCGFAQGEILVFVSGHCIPASSDWLENLVKPIIEQCAVYTYGCQKGNGDTKFSEHQVFKKYYPSQSNIPQEGFFCNNANAALLKKQWQQTPYCELLTGLEDMHLAKKLVEQNNNIAYVAEAPVYHIHEESWSQVKNRYERESIALQKIMPEVHVNFLDFITYYFSAITHDITQAKKQNVLFSNFKDILLFRLMQYWGSYKGNHEHKKLSAETKKKYFYPKH